MLNHEIFQILMRYKTISAERAFTPRANHGYKYLALLAIPGTQPLKRHSVIWRSSAQLGTLCKYLSFPFFILVPKIKEYTIGFQMRLDVQGHEQANISSITSTY